MRLRWIKIVLHLIALPALISGEESAAFAALSAVHYPQLHSSLATNLSSQNFRSGGGALVIWNRFAELRTGAEFQQLPWSQNDGQLEINHFVLQGGVMLLESFALGTGALYKKNSIDNNQSEQILSSIITLGKKWADHTRTLFFTWPLLIPNYFPLHLSLSFLERNWQSRLSLSWKFREEISLSVEERIRLCPLLSLALAASGPPTSFKIGIAFHLRKNRLEMGVQNHPHWGTLGVVELSRDLSLHHEKKASSKQTS